MSERPLLIFDDGEIIHMPPSRGLEMMRIRHCVKHNDTIYLQFDKDCFVKSGPEHHFEPDLPSGEFKRSEKPLGPFKATRNNAETVLVCFAEEGHQFGLMLLETRTACKK